MKAIKFKQANRNLLKPNSMTDEECKSLWVFTDNRECISCWKLSFKQRLSALFFGTVCKPYKTDDVIEGFINAVVSGDSKVTVTEGKTDGD